jgi:hypothetical protein
MVDDITFVGLDVSKRTISVAVAPGDPREAVVYFGTIEHKPDALRRPCKKLSGTGCALHFCYEAGPFGYHLHRGLAGWGHRPGSLGPCFQGLGDKDPSHRDLALAG